MTYATRFGVLRSLILASLLGATQLSAQVAGLPGRVVSVDGQDVTMTIFHEVLPQPGDSVEIGYELTPGDWVSIGLWRVLDLNGDLVRATAVCALDAPAPGHTVLVLRRGQEQPSTSQSPAFTAGDPRSSCQANEIAINLQDLASPDSRSRRNAAKTLYRHYRYERIVQDAAEESLLTGYMENARDPQHVDALAWLTNILGASGDPRFKETLATVAKDTPNRKLHKYAKKNLKRLG